MGLIRKDEADEVLEGAWEEGWRSEAVAQCVKIVLAEKGLPFGSVQCNGPGGNIVKTLLALDLSGEGTPGVRLCPNTRTDIAALKRFIDLLPDTDPGPETTTLHLRTILSTLRPNEWYLGSNFTICDALLFPHIHNHLTYHIISSMDSVLKWYYKCRSRDSVEAVIKEGVRSSKKWQGVPPEIICVVLEFTGTNEVLLMQLLCKLWACEARRVLRSRLPVVHGLLPCEVVYDGWTVRAGRTSLRISGKGFSAAGGWLGLSKLLSWLEKLMNPSPKGEPTSPPWAPGGDRRQLEVNITGPVLSPPSLLPQQRRFVVDLAQCDADQRAAALALRNWLLVVEELPGAAGPLDGLSLCSTTPRTKPEPAPEDGPNEALPPTTTTIDS
eukprot:TRINITY_DN42535_c0_g1_i1.p1 TRINITY_DN42535_c0_g1~~TRINITY_DN42535_c0_g1_i1.p1  ORF type:complete len:400 (+),score=53.00 TRINITY_DN42535_c0_g1_i1:52-1200(+)